MIEVFVITSSIRNSSNICGIISIWGNLSVAGELGSYWPAYEEEVDWWHWDIHVGMEEIVRRNVWGGRLKRTEWSTGLRKWWKWKGKEFELRTTWWFKRELIMWVERKKEEEGRWEMGNVVFTFIGFNCQSHLDEKWSSCGGNLQKIEEEKVTANSW